MSYSRQENGSAMENMDEITYVIYFLCILYRNYLCNLPKERVCHFILFVFKYVSPLVKVYTRQPKPSHIGVGRGI